MKRLWSWLHRQWRERVQRREPVGSGRLIIAAECLLLAALCAGWAASVPVRVRNVFESRIRSVREEERESENDYIKWVEFDVPCEALQRAYEWDVDTHEAKISLNWIELLAYLAATYGGDFSRYRQADLDELARKLTDEETTMELLTADMKHYAYYLEAYTAVLGGMVGEYEIETKEYTEPGEEDVVGTGDGAVWERRYGLKAFLPIAKGYAYQDYDDFGSSRSYGYSRPHLGHDMMALVGTPVVAVESGYVEALGWNQYGGWRIGIRSFDRKRYYYYAHLRKDFPYNKSLKEGSIVQAGDVIGYVGRTGYSAKENVNNIDTAHLHWGLQLIFDESQKESDNEIWVDCYQLTRFLCQNRSETVKNEDTKEYTRVWGFCDPAVP